MPLHKGKYLEPDEAVAAGLCPECGDSLNETDAETEIAKHYTTVAHGRAPNVESDRRAELIRSYYANPAEVK
jgi:hypothetical protein